MTVKVHEIVEDYEPVVLYSEKKVGNEEMKNNGYQPTEPIKAEPPKTPRLREVKLLETAPLTDATLKVLKYLSYEMVHPEHCEYLVILMAVLRTLFPERSITIKSDDDLNECFVIE